MFTISDVLTLLSELKIKSKEYKRKHDTDSYIKDLEDFVSKVGDLCIALDKENKSLKETKIGFQLNHEHMRILNCYKQNIEAVIPKSIIFDATLPMQIALQELLDNRYLELDFIAGAYSDTGESHYKVVYEKRTEIMKLFI